MGFGLKLRQYLWPDSSALKTLESEINFFDDFQQQSVPSFVMNKMCLKAEINCMQTKDFFDCHTVNEVMYSMYRAYLLCDRQWCRPTCSFNIYNTQNQDQSIL